VTEACSFSTLPESTQNIRLSWELRPRKSLGLSGWHHACLVVPARMVPKKRLSL